MSAQSVLPTSEQLAREIETLRAEFGPRLTIMGHHYQNDRIVAHCDITGDSLALARQVPDIHSEHIVLCGVFFMGESAALMAAPGQRVYLPEPGADCTMARMIPGKLLERVLERLTATGRKLIPLAYVNTSLDVKAVVGRHGGAVCTSANAAAMLDWARKQGDGVLFVPDKNLGRNVAAQLGMDPASLHILDIRQGGEALDLEAAARAELLLWPGLCSIHAKFNTVQMDALRSAHPDCRIIVHPECAPDVVAQADACGSTARIIEFVRGVPDNSVVGVGTEINQVRRLAATQKERGVTVTPLCVSACCNMAAVTPTKLLRTLEGIKAGTATPVTIPEEWVEPARLSVRRMIEVCA